MLFPILGIVRDISAPEIAPLAHLSPGKLLVVNNSEA